MEEQSKQVSHPRGKNRVVKKCGDRRTREYEDRQAQRAFRFHGIQGLWLFYISRADMALSPEAIEAARDRMRETLDRWLAEGRFEGCTPEQIREML